MAAAEAAAAPLRAALEAATAEEDGTLDIGPPDDAEPGASDADTTERDEDEEGSDAPTSASEDDEPEGDDDAEAGDESPRLGLRALDDKQIIALRRARIDDETISALDDAALIRLADRLADNQAEWETAYQRSRGDAKEAEPAKGAEGGPARSPSPEPAPDLAVDAEPVAKLLGLEAEDVKTLATWGDSIARRSEARAVKAEQSAQAAHAMVGQLIAEQVRGELKGEYPDLAIPATWEKVRAKARAISPGYQDGGDMTGAMRRLLRDATMLTVGSKPKKAPAKADAKQGTDSRDVGKPTSKGVRKPAPAKQTPEQSLRDAARAALKKHGLREHPF